MHWLDWISSIFGSPFAKFEADGRRTNCPGFLSGGAAAHFVTMNLCRFDPTHTLSHFVRQLKSDGTTIILSTHTMRDLLEITDRALVLRKKHAVFDGEIAQLFNASELEEWDLEVPLEILIANALRQTGIPVPYDCLRWETVLTWLHNNAEGGRVIL
jgi:hypothetical protein